ncbi:hypothetical protein AC579_3507 [Pseudocercospora musae]|uniref:Major facilitator superfamily (MFS) profile domain-containing protein n=1 Tax=Pseudocercospora musae TaxID=113226 RepID=A0A139I3C6_9PEZI|nr:hypothetical protein AC579_3507 [Pseudocercospora musae]KXT09229.1 hypothetical protein AC579_3507 [Pseudocercospora musae]KXT09230.1 hypothetical protein AC579_3507 [Pseudocercospora musae]KXT09231.1 hypothetical protein AC579_3507 [Pseudocercospora musae]
MGVSPWEFMPYTGRQPSSLMSGAEKQPRSLTFVTTVHGSRKSVDEAYDFLAQHVEIAGEESVDLKKLRRRIDWHLMPIMFALYFFQFLDKSLLNYAIIMGLPKDLKLKGNELNNIASSLWWAYLAMSPLVGLIQNKVRLGKWLGFNMFLWGIVISCTAAVKTYHQFLAIRILMGAFDSAIPPALMLLSAQYYRKDEQAMRYALWFSSVGWGHICGGLISFGFQHVSTSTLEGWRIMFLVLGLISLVAGALSFIFMPDTPMAARFLTNLEKKALLQHVAVNKTGVSSHNIEWYQLKEVLVDPQVWLLTLNVIIVSAGTGILTIYGATLVKSFGFTSKEAPLLQMPGGVVAVVATLFFAYAVRQHWVNRVTASLIGYALSLVGTCMIAFADKTNKGAMLSGIYMISFSVHTVGIKYQWIAANVGGHTKRAASTAIVSGAFAIGNIVAPYAVQKKFAPDYQPARLVLVASKAVALGIITLLGLYYLFENRRRNKKYGPAGEQTPEEVNPDDWANMTDKEKQKSFRYVY